MRNQKEIIVFLLILSLHKTFVNDTSRGWIYHLALFICNKEPLANFFIDNNQGYYRSCFCLVVEIIDDFLHLWQFIGEYKSSHWIAYSISVDNDVIWKHLFWVLLCKRFHSILQSHRQVSVDDFLILLLDDSVTVVLAKLLVYGCTKTNNWVSARMTHINSNQHGSSW